MASNSSIEWTQATWNPVTGCTKISPGCKNCYAERMANRLKLMGQVRYRNGFELTLQPVALEEPYKWRTPKLIFVNSMSDLFHEEVPYEYLLAVFKVMKECSHHQFQILTKRSDRLKFLGRKLEWAPNIWMGVSIENEKYAYRVDDLRDIPAFIRFLSVEPLLGPIQNLDLKRIHWVIVGGESGPGARPVKAEWVKRIHDLCRVQNVAFFFKQWGGTRKSKTGRLLDGKEWNEMPPILNVQESF